MPGEKKKELKCYRENHRKPEREMRRGCQGSREKETRLRMAAYSFIISCSFRSPDSPVDSRDNPVT